MARFSAAMMMMPTLMRMASGEPSLRKLTLPPNRLTTKANRYIRQMPNVAPTTIITKRLVTLMMRVT